ncbi:MAG: insulinase family protein [Myxococcales bacterium]|nr:insulinase family protein [Myxococcales bacterium]
MLTLAFAAALLAPAPAPASAPDIPHKTFTLDNGLVVIIHEDRRVPLVAVNLDYRVGSADEPKGRTGFAHLFEHLMFMGTAEVGRGEFDAIMEAEGAWNNAWTSNDRTNYFEVGPSHALPLLLWLEADRLLGLGRAIDQEKLDLQRDVVRNERRQTSENTPYGAMWLELPGMIYPEGHPYHHPVIGSHEDLQAATVADVQQFFARWYVPRNASLVVAGDVDAAEVERQVRALFGPIPAGAPPREGERKPEPPAPPAVADREIEDRVDQARAVFVWRTPAEYHDGDAALDLLAAALADGKSSRLYQALVYGEEVAQDVFAAQMSGRIGSEFIVWATGRDGIDAAALQARLEAALAKAIAAVDDDDVARARAKTRKAFVEQLQSVHGRASALNGYQSALGRPDYVAEDLARYTALDAAALRAAAAQYLTPAHRATLRVRPRPAETPTENATEAPTEAPAENPTETAAPGAEEAK